MNLTVKLAAIALSAAPMVALAECETTPAEFLPALSETARAARAKAFDKACAKTVLHDMDDKRVAARAGIVPADANPGKRINEDFIAKLPPNTVEPGQQTTAIVSFVIEADGKISDQTLIAKSGNRDYDNEAMAAVRRAKTYAVMTVDGQPARVFLTMPFTIGSSRR